jgi:hypothetical protein
MDKGLELHYLERFKSLISDFPDGEVEVSERPDFIIQNKTGAVGIELTELHKQAPLGKRELQANQAMWNLVTQSVLNQYKLLGLPNLYATLHFNQSYEISKSEGIKLSRIILDIITNNIPEEGCNFSEEYDWINRDYFPEHLHQISMTRLPGQDETFFNNPMSTWVGPLPKTLIEETIRFKESKLPAYQKRCSHNWLLITIDTAFMSTWFSSDECMERMEFTTDFDRVYILKSFENRVVRLKVIQTLG